MGTGVPSGITTAMTDADLLTLTQWLSPAFPVGSFAYSHGLEQAIDAGAVRDAEALFIWLSNILDRGTGRSDAVLLCAAQKRSASVEALSDLARALCSSRERWEETRAQGAAFTDAFNALNDFSHDPAPLPVAVGHAASLLHLAPERVAALYLHAFASNLVSCAVRFMPLGQNAGQRVLARLHPLIEAVGAEAATTRPEAIRVSTPGADLGAMQHETMDVRIFKT